MLRFALRHAFAHRRRAALLGLSLALGGFLLVVGSAIVVSLEQHMVRGLRQALIGDLQVFAASNPVCDLTEEVPLDFAPLPEPESLVPALAADPEVLAVAPRLAAMGLVMAGEQSAPVVLTGIDANREVLVTPMLRASAGRLPQVGKEIMLGEGLARRLNLRPGQLVTVLLPTVDGLYEGDELLVVGLQAPAGVPLAGELFAHLPLATLQPLLAANGGLSGLQIRLRDGGDAAAARGRIAGRLAAGGHPAVRILTWEEYGGPLLRLSQASLMGLAIGFLSLALIIGFGIANTTLIVVFERTRDIGTMLALGTTRARVLGALMLEITIIASLAASLGAGLAALMIGVLAVRGLPVTAQALVYALGTERFYPVLVPAHVAGGAAALVALAVVAALVPAIHGCRIDPIRALRFV
ncbi:MAG: ABC transporter permease [Candidatus Schekmanbacteria bacterium]|nr:ABC transporter permease [Candidatus Schekmanbacteria bacterium]